MNSFFRYVVAWAALAVVIGLPIHVSAQLPSSFEAQLQLFNSLSPAQQQALLRQLPASQREAITRVLRGDIGATDSSSVEGFSEAELAELAGEFSEGLVDDEDAEEEEPVFAAGDTLVIEFRLKEASELALPVAQNELQGAVRDDFLRRLVDRNPYELDDAGRLNLPGVPSIQLAGLDVEQATVRLNAQRELRQFGMIVTRLPLDPVGTDALEPYGYELFGRGTTSRSGSGVSSSPILSRLERSDNIPVPVDYVIGPGDTIELQLRGNPDVNGEYSLTVSREGTINLPELGPLNVNGQTFDSVSQLIDERIGQQLLGATASVTLGALRSITVPVLGEVVRPGSYTVNSLVTITDALFRSGGINDIGSLRRIELKRGGQTISTLDIYDLTLRGDTSGDQRLQQGDSVFVPTVGPTVAVDGEVLRPAIYELNGEQTVAELVALAGGLTPNASPDAAKLERIVPGRGISVTDLNLAVTGGTELVRDGDVIRVAPNLDMLEGTVRLMGNVQRGGLHSWYPGMTLSRLLPGPDFVKPMSDLNYVLIRREPRPNVDVQVLSADIEAIWDNRPGAADLALEPRDTVFVFHVETGRRQFVVPVIEELEAQIRSGAPLPTVRVGGQVRAGGEYPLEPGMRVSDLLRAGGGLSDAAYATKAELTRYSIVAGEERVTELIPVDLSAILGGDLGADIPLMPYDILSVSEISGWRGEETVTLRGEFVRPGIYPIRRGETLRSVLERAGGLTEFAFAEGSVFTRVELRQREQEERQRLAARIEADLAAVDLSQQGASDAVETGQILLRQLRDTEATGRQVIRLDDILAGTALDVPLDNGDALYVPKLRQEVTVIGEVQYPTSHTYESALGRDEYVEKSGGLTRRADKGRVYVVRANGEVVANRSGRWFRRGQDEGIRPGDTVVAPMDVDRVRPLQLWAEVGQIVYSMAIAAAAVNSF